MPVSRDRLRCELRLDLIAAVLHAARPTDEDVRRQVSVLVAGWERSWRAQALRFDKEERAANGRAAASQAETSAKTLTMSSTIASIRALSSPSPMTRMTGSVPDGRITSRP